MCCVREKKVFRSWRKTVKTGLAGSLVTSSRPPGQPQKRPDDWTLNAGVTVWTADGSRRTANAANEQCLRCKCGSPSCTVGALCCRHRWTEKLHVYSGENVHTARTELNRTPVYKLQCERPHWNTCVQKWLSTNCPSFAAAKGVLKLMHVTNET